MSQTITAEIFKLESFGTHDGDGIRFCVFFRGCPLRCAYCHNAESWGSTKSETYTPSQLVSKISRYKTYFTNGGGVTFSGGEPLLYSKFLIETMKLLKPLGIGSYIDTSGALPLSVDVKKAISMSETVMLDLKFTTSEGYKKYCEGDVVYTLKTLDYLQSINKNTWIRTVIIPSINDNEQSVLEYFNIIKDYSCISKYELLPFHTMGFDKYEKLGLENQLKNVPAMDVLENDKLQKYLDELMQSR